MMCVHDLVGKQAAEFPNAIAVVSGHQTLTYEKLELRSNRLANLLCRRGVKPDVPVGICMARSADFVVSALAVMKAGCPYIPIDATYPANRIAQLLQDSQAPLVLTQPCLADQIPSGRWQHIVVDHAMLENESASALPNEMNPDSLAYVIFTSGSTGRPKGVQITHRNLLNLIAWHQRAFQVGPNDRATLHASPGFDAAVWELWPYLASGSSLYVVDEEVRTSAEALRDWLVAKEITISFIPTALAELLISLPWPAETALRFLLTGADTLRHYPRPGLPFALVNNYGPTECTVVATSTVIPADGYRSELPPIGRAIDNVQIHIVDDELRPVAHGTAGELVIGGAGVGRGYLNLPEATSDKFVRDPFCSDPTARLYRTGDLVRALPDGQIAFLGRVDEQIKIRGFRIEPQEIRAVLDRHPAIRDSFVSPHRDESGETRLIAYIVIAGATIPTPKELQKFLGEYLPDYMVPSAFVRIEALPFTDRGKVDRAALPAPSDANLLADEAFEAPQSPVEEKVCSIVASLLRVSRLGRNDNFFTLGGHSLLGAQIIAKLRDSFGVELSLRSLFDAPTVAGISLQVEDLVQAKLAAMSEEEVERLLASSGM